MQALLSMQYSTAALRLLAIEDVLSGPEHLHRDLGTKMAALRELRQQFTDARASADLADFPPARRKTPDSVKTRTTPTNPVNLMLKAAAGTLRQFRKPRDFQRPQLALPYQDAGWFVLAKLDSVVVSAPDGTTAAWYKRDRKQFLALARRSAALHLRLAKNWPRLARQYRGASAEVTSPAKWRETFEASLRDRPASPPRR